MNRTALGLAVGAGYLLGRTKKLKMAMAVGSLVAGKKLNLSPKMLADLVNQQLKNNPQVKEIGDQLRQDLRGVGKAASGAMVERQMSTLADRLHGRTAQVRDQLSGVVPGGSAEESDDEDAREDSGEQDERGEAETSRSSRSSRREGDDGAGQGERKRAPAKKSAAKKAEKTGAVRKAAAKKTAAAGGAARDVTGRQSKGGDDR
ncbi:DNA primase [Streptomyces sp. NPDC012751]|uniref:DNA primase n=1 Tax=Streptomyces sp. NPDC012751 TaxID=3364846 RepID=UPI0036CBD3E5